MILDYSLYCDVCDFYIFFFQAEDGIRDLVRSRGLGDVYKRQLQQRLAGHGMTLHLGHQFFIEDALMRGMLVNQIKTIWPLGNDIGAVSYTHLTLPTSDLV